MKKTFKPQLAVVSCVVAGIFLSGCASERLQSQIDRELDKSPTEHINETIPTAGIKGTAADLKARADMAKGLAVVRSSPYPWIGGSMVPVTKEDGLPAVFNEPYVLSFGDARVPLSAVAAKLTKVTGVPVRIRSDVYGIPISGSPAGAANVQNRGNNQNAAQTATMSDPSIPSSAVASLDTMTIDGVSVNWNGKLRDFLEHLTNVLNLSWEYRDGSVVILKMLTQTHTIAGMVGEQTFSNSMGSTTSGSSGGGGAGASGGSGGTTNAMQNNSNYAEKGKLDGFESIVATVKSMVGTVPGTAVIANPQAGNITVTASKEVQAQVRDYIEEQNKILRRMVSVQIDIYSITDTDDDEQGINLNAAFKAMTGNYGINFTSPATLVGTGVSALTLSGVAGEGAGSTAILNALRSTGKSVVHKPIQLLTMNGKLKVQNSTETQGYVQSTTPGVASASGSAGAPGINTSSLTTGDVFAVLPIVQPDNSVLLKYSFRMSNFLGFRNIVSGTGATAQSVEAPHTSDVGDGTDIRLLPGEAIMITGLSRTSTSTSSNRLSEGAPIGLGGSIVNTVQREHFIVVLRANAL